jgi:pyridoxine 5'-phosphate synthase PdxJ
VRRRQLSVERARLLAAQGAGILNLDQVNAGPGGGATPGRISKMTESAMSDNLLNRLRRLVATQAEQGGLTVREGHGLTRQIAQLALLSGAVQRPGPRVRR